jgi:hypothetical protein
MTRGFVVNEGWNCALGGAYRGLVSPYLRTVKTSSGATAVQTVHSSHRGSRDIEHLGSAHTADEVELLKAAGRQKLAAGQGELDLGLATGAPGAPLPIIASRMSCLTDALGPCL